MMFSAVIAALPDIKPGKLRPFAVSSATHVTFAPEVRTVGEQGCAGVGGVALGGLMASDGIPKDVVDHVDKKLQAVLPDTDVQASCSAPAQSLPMHRLRREVAGCRMTSTNGQGTSREWHHGWVSRSAPHTWSGAAPAASLRFSPVCEFNPYCIGTMPTWPSWPRAIRTRQPACSTITCSPIASPSAR